MWILKYQVLLEDQVVTLEEVLKRIHTNNAGRREAPTVCSGLWFEFDHINSTAPVMSRFSGHSVN